MVDAAYHREYQRRRRANETLEERVKRLASLKAYRDRVPDLTAAERQRRRYKKGGVVLSEKVKERIKKWRKDNPEKIKLHKRTRRTNPANRLRDAVGSSIYSALKSMKAGAKWERLVGYTLDDLVKHLERQFVGKMKWKNYGSYWELEHIVPLASFKMAGPDDPEFRVAWALTNLRPFPALDNRSKGGKRIHLL